MVGKGEQGGSRLGQKACYCVFSLKFTIKNVKFKKEKGVWTSPLDPQAYLCLRPLLLINQIRLVLYNPVLQIMNPTQCIQH